MSDKEIEKYCNTMEVVLSAVDKESELYKILKEFKSKLISDNSRRN